MTLEEMRMRKAHNDMVAELKVRVKALYLIGTLEDVYDYLYAKVDKEDITEAEADSIIKTIANECACIYQWQINELTTTVKQLGH